MPLTTPQPSSAPTLRERTGEERSRSDSAASVNDTISSDHPSPAVRERGRGWVSPSPPPCPFLSHAVGEEGGMSGAGAILRWHLSTMPSPPPRSPLSRSAGEGPGVRVARSAGEGPGVRATPHLVPLSYTAQKYVGPPHAMIARVRDTPNERSAFSIRR